MANNLEKEPLPALEEEEEVSDDDDDDDGEDASEQAQLMEQDGE